MGGRGSCRAEELTRAITAQRELRPPVTLRYLLGFDNRPATVLATVRANDVRRLHRATLRAGLKLLGGQPVVRATHAGT